MYSKEHQIFLKKEKVRKTKIILIQLLIVFTLIVLWQFLSDKKIINNFLYSSPSNILNTINNFNKEELFNHIIITTYETLISFLIASILGLLIASILWSNKMIAKIVEPFLNIINSLPKVALGPLIIIWFGTGIDSIIVMALLISLLLSIINIYNAFTLTEKNYIILLKSLGAKKHQIFFKIVLPYNKKNIFNTFKINISMSLIGVIMGELLVSKRGLGYLIMYGSQVFNINLIITSIFILGVLSYIIYFIINKIEKYFFK
ncbi:MAG: ABC transporter permease [Bacilli bacterium]|nr:ABC transporter permease [Bacilli bacterium]